MHLRNLRVEGFRNLQTQSLEFSPGLTAVVGCNGAGKTSLLEAISVLGNLSSFRSANVSSWIRTGQGSASLEATIERHGSEVAIRQHLRFTGRVSRGLFRGARRLGAAEYLGLFPVVTLSALDRQLVFGPPQERRHFLDRLAFHLEPETLAALQRYRRAMEQRNALLLRGGEAATFDAFEHDLATLGARVIAARRRAVAALEPALQAELAHLGWPAARPNLRYHSQDGSAVDDEVAAARRLRADLLRTRPADRRRGATSVGPHRHELLITVHGAHVREALSAGQGKLLAVAMRLAAMSVLERCRGETPCVVFDDIDAELDSGVLRRVLERLGDGRQVIVSSAHAEMIGSGACLAEVWEMREGAVGRHLGGDGR